MLKPGIYDLLLNNEVQKDAEGKEAQITELQENDVDQYLSHYVMGLVKQRLETFHSKSPLEDMEKKVGLVNEVVSLLADPSSMSSVSSKQVVFTPKKLLSLNEKTSLDKPVLNKKEVLSRPSSSLSFNSLFTGATHDPQLYSELKAEIRSADTIDFLVSFIRWSGLRLILDDLKEFTARGGKLRVVTTTYMSATDFRAVDELSKLPNTTIKINFDTTKTRLHAKAYAFWRDTGFSTAYVGSSNLTNPAITSGLEWNIKLTENESRDLLNRVSNEFEEYWNSPLYLTYGPELEDRLKDELSKTKIVYQTTNKGSLIEKRIQTF